MGTRCSWNVQLAHDREDEFDAISDAEVCKDPGEVGANGRQGDFHLAGDLLVSLALKD